MSVLLDERPTGAMAPFKAWWLLDSMDFDEAEQDWKAVQGDDGFIKKTDYIERVVVVHLPNPDEADVIEGGTLRRVARWALRVEMDAVIR